MHSFYALCAFTVAGLIVSILVLLLYCNPISQNWYSFSLQRAPLIV